MAEIVGGKAPRGVGALPPMGDLLAHAERRSSRCPICKWICENRGAPASDLCPMTIGGVDISPEAQVRHLLSHAQTDSE